MPAITPLCFIEMLEKELAAANAASAIIVGASLKMERWIDFAENQVSLQITTTLTDGNETPLGSCLIGLIPTSPSIPITSFQGEAISLNPPHRQSLFMLLKSHGDLTREVSRTAKILLSFWGKGAQLPSQSLPRALPECPPESQPTVLEEQKTAEDTISTPVKSSTASIGAEDTSSLSADFDPLNTKETLSSLEASSAAISQAADTENSTQVGGVATTSIDS